MPTALGLATVLAVAGCTSTPAPVPLVSRDPDFCTNLIGGVADYTAFAQAVIAGTGVTDGDRETASTYVGAIRASAPTDAGVTAALTTFTTPYEVDRKAQGQNDAAPAPITADQLSTATATLLTACASS